MGGVSPTVSPERLKQVKKRRDPGEPVSPIILFGIPLLLLAGGYFYCTRINPDGVNAAFEQVLGLDRAAAVRDQIATVRDMVAQRLPRGVRQASLEEDQPLTRGQMTVKLAQEAKARAAKEAADAARHARAAAVAAEAAPQNQVTLYLAKGNWVTGELLRETPEEVVLKWDYGEASFRRSEIKRLDRHAQTGAAPVVPQVEVNSAAPLPVVPPAAPEVTLYLKNGGVVTGTLIQESPASLLLRLEGGDVEFTRAEIERIEHPEQGTAPAITTPTEAQAPSASSLSQ